MKQPPTNRWWVMSVEINFFVGTVHVHTLFSCFTRMTSKCYLKWADDIIFTTDRVCSIRPVGVVYGSCTREDISQQKRQHQKNQYVITCLFTIVSSRYLKIEIKWLVGKLYNIFTWCQSSCTIKSGLTIVLPHSHLVLVCPALASLIKWAHSPFA